MYKEVPRLMKVFYARPVLSDLHMGCELKLLRPVPSWRAVGPRTVSTTTATVKQRQQQSISEKFDWPITPQLTRISFGKGACLSGGNRIE